MNFYDILIAKKLSGGGGGGSSTLINKNITANGTYNATDDSADGYKKVVVSVPNTYVAGDEGKVVSGGALVSQTSATYTSNGTYDTTLKNSVTVNISGYSIDDIGTNTAPSGSVTYNASQIAQYAFAYKPFTEMTAPNCTTINSYAFEGAGLQYLDSTHFPSVTTFNSYTARNSGLLRIYLTGTSYNLLPNNVFYNCTNLKVARLPNKSGSSGSSVFYGCTSLKIADLGGTTIGGSSFNGCTKLQTLILRNSSVCTLGNTNSFSNTPFVGKGGLTAVLYVPSSLVSSYQSASNWSTILSNGYTTITAIEGSAYESTDWDDSSFMG